MRASTRQRFHNRNDWTKSPTLHDKSSALLCGREVMRYIFMNWMTAASQKTLFILRQQTNIGGRTNTLLSSNFADNWRIIEVLKRTCTAMNVDNYWQWAAFGNVTQRAAIFNRAVNLQAVFFNSVQGAFYNLSQPKWCKQIVFVTETRWFLT